MSYRGMGYVVAFCAGLPCSTSICLAPATRLDSLPSITNWAPGPQHLS